MSMQEQHFHAFRTVVARRVHFVFVGDQLMMADNMLPPVLDLNSTLVGGESSSEHIKAPQATNSSNLSDVVNLFGQMPTPMTCTQVWPDFLYLSV
jgi:hypothetical protein